MTKVNPALQVVIINPTEGMAWQNGLKNLKKKKKQDPTICGQQESQNRLKVKGWKRYSMKIVTKRELE